MRRRLVAAAAACAAVVTLLGPPAGADRIACAAPAPGGEWPQIGRDLAGSRTQPAEALIGPAEAMRLAPVWTFDANRGARVPNNEITGHPIVAGGCVYVGSSTGAGSPGYVFALNAETGELVWRTKVAGGVYSTVAVAGDRVYAFVSRVSAPFVVALDRADGTLVWEATVDRQSGADAVSSPVVFDGMVWVGVSGTAAEGDDSDRFAFQGSFVLLDAASGARLAKTYTIPPDEWEDGYAGGAVWSTMSVDAVTKTGFVGTGNPFNYDEEHPNTNAVLRIDLDRASPSFGRVTGSYKGEIDVFVPEADALPCEDLDEADLFAAGFECGRLDLDFGAMPNIFPGPNGRTWVGAGQKSGVYHVFDAATMEPVWKATLGVPSLVGGIVGSAAVDAGRIIGPHTIGGYLWAVDRADGDLRWLAPTSDGIHWGNPVTLANRVVYTVDLKGFLDAYEAASGAPLLHQPMNIAPDVGGDPAFSWGAVTVAQGTVYAGVGVGLGSAGMPSMPNGFVIAYRPLGLVPRA